MILYSIFLWIFLAWKSKKKKKVFIFDISASRKFISKDLLIFNNVDSSFLREMLLFNKRVWDVYLPSKDFMSETNFNNKYIYVAL